MATAHNEDRVTESASVKVVKMPFSEEDLRAARLARLEEIKAECEKSIPVNTVFLYDIANIIGLATTAKIKGRANKLKIKTYTRHTGDSFNKLAQCVSEEDAERIIKSYYE
jgi:hypothetical protein